MKAIIENIDHLTKDEKSAVKVVANTINTPIKCSNMEQAKTWLELLSPWFIYQGGSHFAVHTQYGDAKRILIVTE